jgi:hypothetical protein
MTVSSIARRVAYTTNGVTNTFAVPFQFFEVAVYLAGVLVPAVQYVVTQTTPGAPGSVIFLVTPTGGQPLVVVGATTSTQEVDLVDNDSAPAESYEQALDRLTMVDQEGALQRSQTLRAPQFAAPVPELSFADNPNTFVYVGGDGVPALVSPSDPGGPFYPSVSDAAASAAAALAAAIAAGLSEDAATLAAAGAAASEVAAGASEIAAAASASDVDAQRTDFLKRYLGPFAVAPTLDLEGGALAEGALYWNTVSDGMLAWTGAVWQAITAVPNSSITYAKIQNVAVDKILGRKTAGTGVVEEIDCTAAARNLLDDTTTDDQRNTLLVPFLPATKAALRAANTTKNLAAIIDGNVWNNKLYADFSAAAGPDDANLGAQYLRSSFDTSRVWARAGETISLRTFGYEPYKNQNAFTAFNDAIAFLNTLPHGATLAAPSGRCIVDGALNPITSNAKFINFENGSRVTHDGGVLFTWGAGVDNGVLDGGLIGLDYLGSATPAAGTGVVRQDGMNRLLLKNIRATNVLQFLDAGPTAEAGGYFIHDVRLTTVNVAGNVIQHGKGANSEILGLNMTASGVSRTLDETSPTNALATAISFGTERWDTATWDAVLINGYKYGLDVNRTAVGKNVSNFRVSNFYFDYCANGMRLLNTATGGGINNMMFHNGWLVGLDGYGCELAGSVGSHRAILFSSVHSMLAGKANWRLNSQTMDEVVLERCTGDFANRLHATNTGVDQDDFVALFGGFTCHGGRFGRSANGIAAAGVPLWQARYGASLPTSAADYVFEHTTLEGLTASTQASIAANTLTAGKLFSSRIRNNRVAGGAIRPEYAALAPLAAPASTALQTNNTPYFYELHIYGGACSAIAKNSSTIAAYPVGTTKIDIEPGDTWSVTYPTIAATVSAATNASTCVVTTNVAHGLRTGQGVTFSGAFGMTQLNGNSYIVDVLTTTTFELRGTSATGFGSYTVTPTPAAISVAPLIKRVIKP